MRKWNVLKKQGQLALRSKSSGPVENYQIIHNKNVVYETTDYAYALKEMQKYSEELAATAELKRKLMTYTENGFTVTVKGDTYNVYEDNQLIYQDLANGRNAKEIFEELEQEEMFNY